MFTHSLSPLKYSLFASVYTYIYCIFPKVDNSSELAYRITNIIHLDTVLTCFNVSAKSLHAQTVCIFTFISDESIVGG